MAEGELVRAGLFQKGGPGGPGRPKGSKPKLITALQLALDEDETLETLKKVAMDKLKAGDPQFWNMLLARVWPVPLRLDVPADTDVTFTWRTSSKPAEEFEEAEIVEPVKD